MKVSDRVWYEGLGLLCRRNQKTRGTSAGVKTVGKLHALVYDTLPSATAVFSYAIGSRKLSANEQFFVGAQTVIKHLRLYQTFVL